MNAQAQIDMALQRLERFTTLEHEYGDRLNEMGLRLLRASTFAAYCDCRALGIGARAQTIIDRARQAAIRAATPSVDQSPAKIAS